MTEQKQKRQKIRIVISGYDPRAVDNAADSIVQTASGSGATVKGPIPLPTKVYKLSVNRSPHVDKKSMEQFEDCRHKRIIDILDPTVQSIEKLRQLNFSTEIDIVINL